jgi:hypothetical protein
MRRNPLVSALVAVFAVYRLSSHAWAGNIDVPTAVVIPRAGPDPLLDRQVRRRLAVLRHAEEVTGNVEITCRY